MFGIFEDDVPFPQVGYVNFLEGVMCFFLHLFGPKLGFEKFHWCLGFYREKKSSFQKWMYFLQVADVKTSPNSYILMTCLFSPKMQMQLLDGTFNSGNLFETFQMILLDVLLKYRVSLSIISNQIKSNHITYYLNNFAVVDWEMKLWSRPSTTLHEKVQDFCGPLKSLKFTSIF